MSQLNQSPLKKIPVILVILFDILTVGIYSCCWFLSRREAFNKMPSPKRLNAFPFIFCIIISVIGIFLMLASGVCAGIAEALEDTSYLALSAILENVSDGLDIVYGITLLVQSFKAKALLEGYVKQKNQFDSLSGTATFFFRNYYLQYRINLIHKNHQAEPVNSAEAS
jgi:hypothetical protein